MKAGCQVFLFFLFFPIFWENSYFSKKIPIFSYFLSIYNFFMVILSLILLSMIFYFKKSFILYKVFSNFPHLA